MDYMPPRMNLSSFRRPFPPPARALWCPSEETSSKATPAAAKVEAFLAEALEAAGGDADMTAGALVPWICDALLSNHSVKAYGRDLMDFIRHMQASRGRPSARDTGSCEIL